MKTSGLLALLLIFGSAPKSAAQTDFYIAPNGNNGWSGKLAEPNAERTDGPFATLEKARNEVRKLRVEEPNKHILVQLRGGQYHLKKTIVFGLEDSSGQASTTYQAVPGEIPIFHSDLPLTGWEKPPKPLSQLPKEAQGNVWVTEVPKLKNKPRRFYTLFDESGLLTRARSQGFIPVKSKAISKYKLPYPSGTIRNWPNLEDIEIVVRPHHAWIVNILPLASVNEEKQIATTRIPATYGMNELHFLKGTKSVWVENVIEALDEPGEWVFNSLENKLYLWPKNDEALEGIGIPQLQEYLRIEGDIDELGAKDIPVKNLTFRGLTFTRGESYRIAEDDKGLQHDWEMHDKPNALIRLRGTENCTIENCHFTQSGGGAIRVDLHGQNNKIQSNHIEHIGGTGILISGYGPGTKDVSHHNLVSNNHIHHVGEIYAHSPGIFLWQSGENRIAHNLIHHTPYSGIIISGVMTQFFSKNGNARELVRTIRRHETGPKKRTSSLAEVRPFLHSHDNLIELNEIHHVMQELNDGNGIYIRGCGSGNIIRRNYLHHLLAPTVMQSSIRTDGGQRDTLITENLIFRCVAQGMQIKLNNRAVNNIIADIRPGIHQGEERPPTYLKLYEGPMTGGAYQRNILYHPGSEAAFYQEIKNFRVPHGAYAKDAETHSNIYYSPNHPTLAQDTLHQKQREGVDKNSLAQDPLFLNPKNGDFRLKEHSPAHKLGIIPLDISKIGLLPQKP